MVKRHIKRIKKRFGPRPGKYSDINKRFVWLISIIGILLLLAVIYYISTLMRPPNITMASKEIFSKGMITVGVRTDLGEYSQRNPETGELEGFEIDVCEEVLQRIFRDQVVIRYEQVTTTTRLSKLNRQEIDVGIGAIVPNSSDRISLNYSEGFFVDSVALVTRKDQRLNVLSANTVLVGTLNNAYADDYIESYFAERNKLAAQENQQTYKITPYACYQDLFHAVETFDADVLAASMLFIDQNMTDELVILPDRMLYHEYCFAFNSRDVELTKVFSEAIVAMKADGTLQALREKWHMDTIFKG